MGTDSEEEDVPESGGDPACWAGLLCQDCGRVLAEGHAPDCPSRDDEDAPSGNG